MKSFSFQGGGVGALIAKFKCQADAWLNRFAVFLAVMVGVCGLPVSPAFAADVTGPAKPGIVKLTPKMPANAFAGRPDTDLVELSDGRQVRLADIRRLTAAARKMEAARGSRLPAAFKARPAATGAPLKTSADLSAALKRPDTDTVVLPSGRRVTVGMIRQLQPQVEKRLGRPLVASAQRPNLSGPAIKVTAKSDWKQLLQSPDGTVLEAPNGTRITVGELKYALATSKLDASKPARRLTPVTR